MSAFVKPVGLCMEVAVGADDGTSVDKPVWQLRQQEQAEALPDPPSPHEGEIDQALGPLRCGPPGIVATRYLASTTTSPDTHVHVFRETTV